MKKIDKQEVDMNKIKDRKIDEKMLDMLEDEIGKKLYKYNNKINELYLMQEWIYNKKKDIQKERESIEKEFEFIDLERMSNY